MKNLFAVSLLAAALVGCGGSSGSSNNSAPAVDPAPEETPVSAITAEGVQAMQNALDQANTARSELDAFLMQPQKVSFLARLSIGEEQVLATQGALSVKASCIDSSEGDLPPPPPEGELAAIAAPSGSMAKIQISYKSTVPGSLLTENDDYLEQNVNYVFASNSSSTADLDIDESSVVAPTGDHISINGETMMLSTNAQGTDCMVAGMAFVMKGAEAGEFTIPEAAVEDEEE
jgi:hypothetical protein